MLEKNFLWLSQNNLYNSSQKPLKIKMVLITNSGLTKKKKKKKKKS